MLVSVFLLLGSLPAAAASIPVINEIMALNVTGATDEDGDHPDWVEIHNPGPGSVDLTGWYLSDDPLDLMKWQFPAEVLAEDSYLVVFASDKDRAVAGSELHSNFKLKSEGEYLALIMADGVTIAQEFAPAFPPIGADLSYGLILGAYEFMQSPTPGAANIESPFEGIVEKPGVDIKGGCYADAVDVALSCDTPDALIRYTTDGTVPSLINGIDYTGPIHIASLTTILAKGFKSNMGDSETRIETYILVRSAVASFNSNLPIIVLDTLGVAIPNLKDNPDLDPYIDCRAVIIDIDELTGRSVVSGPEHFEGWGMIRRRGESTYGQGHYAFEVQDEYRQDKDVSLLGMPAESDWIINKEVIDYTLLKSNIAFKWFRDMGHYAPRERYVEVYLNTGGGAIATGDYKGIYVLREKIKRNDGRVDIERLNSTHNFEPEVSGGYIIKNDKVDPDDVVLAGLETAPYGIVLDGSTTIVEPKEPTSAQITWISNYMNEFHAVLWQNTASSHYVPGVDYTDYVEETSWIDHCIVEQIGSDADAFRFSFFIHKDRDGKLRSGPAWDFDRAFHNSGKNYGRPYDLWNRVYKIPWAWNKQLLTYPEYSLMFADRWFEHREEVLNTDLNMAYIDETVALITEAMDRTIDKYGFKGDGGTYTGEVNLLKDWITNRLNWLDNDIANRFAEKPPIFSPLGGYVNQGDPLYITKPPGASGTIYYTLDGTDPRLEGGGVNPSALVYNESSGSTTESLVTQSSSTWKYLYDGSDQGTAWRAYGFNDNSWGSGPGQLGFGDGDENTDIGPKVNGRRSAYFRHKFTVSDVAEITDLSIDLLYDDGAVVYINGQEIGRVEMPTGTIAFDTLATGTSSDNKTTTFTPPVSTLNEGNNIIAVEVHQKTDTSSDISFDLGLEATRPPSGPSDIEFDKSVCVRARIKDGADWSAQNKEIYALGPIRENLRISELMYHPTDPTQAEITATGNPDLIDEDFEFIELKNIGGVALNLNLVHFTDGIDFAFGDYTLAAGDYAVLVKNQAAFAARYNTAGINIVPGSYLGALDNGGEEIVLRDALGAEIHDFDYDDSWYRLTDGQGYSLTMVDPASTDPNPWDTKPGWRSSRYVEGTPGLASAAVLEADSIVINEVLAHSHGANPDWIEVHNTTGQDINISGWFLSDDDSDLVSIRKYEIPDPTVIDAGAYMVFVGDTSFDDPSPTGGNVPFGLSEGGETAYLYSGQGGEVTGLYQTQQKFDASETGVSFGRYEKAELSGGYDFVRQVLPTLGRVNKGPLIPDIVITEIYYNPQAGDDYEFVELYNRSGSTVTLQTTVTTETSPGVFVTEDIPWRLEGTGYEFPAGTQIGAGNYILLAKVPANYTSSSCNVYGPYDGKLDNGGEEIEIQIPGDQEYGQLRFWIPIEKIEYNDVAPWPTSPDGGGDSLYRDDIDAYGRDYSNWSAANPTPPECGVAPVGASARGDNPPVATAGKAFDGDVNTKWMDFSPGGSWIQWRYANDATPTVTVYTITSANNVPKRDPMDWNLLGSNDGGLTWDTLDSRSGVVFSSRFETRNFSINNIGAYNIYRLEITAVYNVTTANSVQIAEIGLLTDSSGGDGDGDGDGDGGAGDGGGAGGTATPVAGMPVAGAVGLGLVAAACALGGSMFLRKK